MTSAVAGCLIVLLSETIGAQEIDFKRLLNMCQQTAAKSSPPLAQAVANAAKREHDLFKGHVVDATGRILRFGNVETEVDQIAKGNPTSPSQIPWRNVLRYWETLSGKSAADGGAYGAQTVTYYTGLFDAEEQLSRKKISLQALLKAIGDLSLPEGNSAAIREALRESVIRASLSDVAWSAAFVSSVMAQADVPQNKFQRSASHITYIANAVRQSASDLKTPEADNALYRACDPYAVRPRKGDLICYHRHGASSAKPYNPKPGLTLNHSLLQEIATGAAPISLTHCDVVVDIDRERKKIKLIGGNVQQAVTERTLNINRQEVLSTSQGVKFCETYNPYEKGDGANCNLNSQSWFVLLQAR
ncbi:MAG: DUF2272 domain-containing protein [Pseudomonadota bacterium]